MGMLGRAVCYNSDISFSFTIFNIGWYWIGVISTYLLLKMYNGIGNHEQLFVGLVSLAAIPVTFEVHSSIVAIRGNVATMLSRIFVSLTYTAGGYYAIKTRNDQ
jgi:hypothetical protein